jgi:hypothetical protein
MTRKPNFQRQVRNILLGFALLGLMVIIIAHERGEGFYWLTAFTEQKPYTLVMLGIWGCAIYLLFKDRFSETTLKIREIQILTVGRYLAIPVLSLLLLFVAVGMMISFRHCDTIQTPTAVYHLDLVRSIDRNYRLTQCNQWQMCQVIAQSVDEDVLNGEKLHIDGNFIFATAANRSEPIIWSYNPNGQSVELVDRLSIERP